MSGEVRAEPEMAALTVSDGELPPEACVESDAGEVCEALLVARALWDGEREGDAEPVEVALTCEEEEEVREGDEVPHEEPEPVD